VNALSRLEDELARLRGARGRAVIVRWAHLCPSLAQVATPVNVPGWVWGLERSAADEVLRCLVELAQGGDEVAVSVVLACLRPGLCAMAGRTGVPMDDLVSEATLVVFEFPFQRRRTVAGQLLLDTRKRFSRARARVREIPAGDTRQGSDGDAAEELGAERPAIEQLGLLVHQAWKQGHLTRDAARLVMETRVWGIPVAEAAARRGISRKAVFERRARAEARLREVFQ